MPAQIRRTKSVSGPPRRRRNPPKTQPPQPSQPGRWARARKRAGWPLFALGAAMFLVSNIGARAGIQVLPFDPHHVIGQFGGAAMALCGLIWATTRAD